MNTLDDEIRKGLLTWLVLYGDRPQGWMESAAKAFAGCRSGTLTEAHNRGYFEGAMRTTHLKSRTITISAKGLEFLNGKT